MTNNNPANSFTPELTSNVDGSLTSDYSNLTFTDALDRYVMKIGTGNEIGSYKFDPDAPNSSSYWTNGVGAIQIGDNGNISFTTGTPGDVGCGGKILMKSDSHTQKTGSMTIEVEGRPEDGKTSSKKNDDGTITEEKLPAYSLKAYGDVFIESVGGETVIKADHITLNAISTLNLNSSSDINITAGEGKGRINFHGEKFKFNGAFLEKNLSGGEYSTGAGEVQVDQYNPAASTVVNTPGDVQYTVNGDYTVGVTKNYKLGVTGNYTQSVDTGDYALDVKLGSKSEKVGSKSKYVVLGAAANGVTQKENIFIDAGPGASEIPSYKLTSGGQVYFDILNQGIKVEVAKLSDLTLSQTNFTVNAGKNLGTIDLGPANSLIKYGETSKITLEPARISISQPAGIYLN